MSEIIEERGEYRAVIDIDIYPDEPENEYGCPVLRVEPSGYGGGLVTSTGYGSESYKRDGIRQGGIDALQHFVSSHGWSDGIDIFERWVRIFHGGTVTRWSDRRWDSPTYVAYSTPAMARDAWGADDDQLRDHPEWYAADLDEWAAYCEGEAYLVTVERKVLQRTEHVTLTDNDLLDASEHETWLDIEGPVGGYYGEKRAREAAIEMLDAVCPKVGEPA